MQLKTDDWWKGDPFSSCPQCGDKTCEPCMQKKGYRCSHCSKLLCTSFRCCENHEAAHRYEERHQALPQDGVDPMSHDKDKHVWGPYYIDPEGTESLEICVLCRKTRRVEHG